MSDPIELSDDYTTANRKAWDELEKQHRPATYAGLLKNFSVPGYSYLGDLETEKLVKLGLVGKSVAQLACNNGREIISIRNLGAANCTGFDISEKFIAQGRDFIQAGNIEHCELVAVDVYQIPQHYDHQYDLVFVSVGALILMPDLERFFSIAARLLKSNGQIFIYERHPMLDMFNWDDENDPPVLVESYFNREPRMNRQTVNYWTKETIDCSPMYTFHHTLSDIFQALLANRFEIREFEEYEHDISEKYIAFEQLRIKPALCYALTAQLK